VLLLHASFYPRKGGEQKSCEEVDLGTSVTLEELFDMHTEEYFERL